MNYYLYESDINRKVRVHIGNCKFCKEGKVIAGTPALTSRWHGPFDTLAAAKEVAKSLKQKDTRTCALCLDGKRF